MPEVRDWAKVYMWYSNTFNRLATTKDYGHRLGAQGRV